MSATQANRNEKCSVSHICLFSERYDFCDFDSEDDSNDVVLAFIASEEEYVDERPATTRSGRAVTRRAEIDFSFF